MTSARILWGVLLAASGLTSARSNAEPEAKPTRLITLISRTGTRRPTVARNSAALRTATKRLYRRSPTYTVTATVYEAVPSQTDSEPFVTADNSRIKRHYGTKKRWLALSRDLLKRWGGQFDYGDKVQVRGISAQLDGVYTVHDTMNRRFHHCLDVLAHPSEHLSILTKGVKIYKVAP